jgi:hypothetical protein
VQDEQAALDGAGARVLAVPHRGAERAAEERHGERNAVGDRQPHARQQVVGERVAGEALEDPRAEQQHAEHPDDLARLAEGAGEERAGEVRDDRHHEDERRPVMGLAHHEARGHARREVQHGVVGGRDAEAHELAERAGVGRVRSDVRVEEQRQVGAREDQEDEGVERDLAEQERPVLGEDVAQRTADERAGAEALVHEAHGLHLMAVGAHDGFTPQYDGPTDPESAPAATSVRSEAMVSGSWGSARTAGPKTGLAARRTSKVE